MPMRLLGTLATATMILTACSSSGNLNGVSTDPFSGVWTCTEVDALQFTTPANSPPEELGQSVTLNVEQTGTTVKTQASTDAGSSCPISYTSVGDAGTASLTATSTCSAQGLSFTYGSGTITSTSSSLTVSLDFTFTGTLTADGGEVSVAGTGTTTQTCTR